MYSEPASSRAAVRIAVVRLTSSFASASSRLCAELTPGKPSGCSRLRTTGGPPSCADFGAEVTGHRESGTR
eukprot:25715-Pleurochrysis_carterae.AAC.1